MPPKAGGTPPGPEEEPDRGPNAILQAELFACADPEAPRSSPARIARLGREEWLEQTSYVTDASANGYQARIDAVSLPQGSENQYSSYPAGESLEMPVIDQYFRYDTFGFRWGMGGRSSSEAPYLHVLREGGEHEALRCFIDGGAPSQACRRDFVEVLLREGIYQDEPTAAEIDRLDAYTVKLLAQEEPGGNGNVRRGVRRETIQKMWRAASLTYRAMFRTELGERSSGERGRARMTDIEIGNALARALTDYGYAQPTETGPGQDAAPEPERRLPELWEAVQDGTIGEPETIERLVRLYVGGGAAALPAWTASLSEGPPHGSYDAVFDDGFIGASPTRGC